MPYTRAPKGQGALRVPAAGLDAAVVQQLCHVMKAADLLAEQIRTEVARNPELDEAKVTLAIAQVNKLWSLLAPPEQARLLHQLIKKVVVNKSTL